MDLKRSRGLTAFVLPLLAFSWLWVGSAAGQSQAGQSPSGGCATGGAPSRGGGDGHAEADE